MNTKEVWPKRRRNGHTETNKKRFKLEKTTGFSLAQNFLNKVIAIIGFKLVSKISYQFF